MDRRLLAVVGVVVLIGLWFFMSRGLPGTELCFNSQGVVGGSKCITVEIADNDKSRSAGLSNRGSLGEDRGMLFVFDAEGKTAFWMKKMNFPLDIIWLNGDKEVVDISKNLPPCKQSSCPTYAPRNNSLYVVEVNAHFTDKYNITNKTVASFKLPK
jgi:uncharacterized membrane protein (UPF0127 family)